MRTLFLLAALCLAARAQGQPCSTPTISVVLRDAQGVNVHTEVSQVELTPAKGILAPYHFGADEVRPGGGADSVYVLRLWGPDCRIYLGEMAVRRGGEEMRLLACVRVRSTGKPGPRRSIHLVIDTPPFHPGRWVLADARLPRVSNGFMWMDAGRWMRQDGGEGCRGSALGERRRMPGVREAPDSASLPRPRPRP